MTKKGKYLCLVMLLAAGELIGQGQKVSFSGASRSELFNSKLEAAEADTVTAPRRNGGYALLDLGVNVQVNEKTEVQGMFRIRNEFGGFWGANTLFSVRQLYLKGVVANSIRYQVGDIDQRMTPYTLYNNEQDMGFGSSALFSNQQNQLDYDLFYTDDNTWRQQGAAFDMGIEFKKILKEVRLYGLMSRAGVTNFTNLNDQLFGGLNIGVFTQSNTYIGFNHVNLFDLLGTAEDSSGFSNAVNTLVIGQDFKLDDHQFEFRAELGQSRSYMRNDTTMPDLDDAFWDASVNYKKKDGIYEIRLGLRNVGADFRSAGAQTKRINYQARPALYQNYTNDQIFRPFDMVDLMRDVTLYNTQLQSGLMEYNPAYGNVTPYGQATPNRAGVYGQVKLKDKKQYFDLDAQVFSGRQIRGEGTLELKNYMRSDIDATIDVQKIMETGKMAKLTIGHVMENTTRTGEADFENNDLSTSMLELGIEAELIEGLDIIASYRSLNSSGKDNYVLRNAAGEVINFPEFRTELTQTILGAGLRYRFSEKSNISAQQMFSDSQDELSPELDYNLNMFVLLFTTKF